MYEITFNFLLILSISSLIMGMSRGGVGGGAGLAGVLLAAQVLPPIQAAAFLLPILVITDPISIWLYKKNINWASLKVLLPGVTLGLIIAYFTVSIISDNFIKLVVGILSIALFIDGIKNKLSSNPSKKLPPVIGLVLGCLAGFSSFLIHSGLPPVAAYLLPQKLSRQAFMGTVAIFFGITNIVKIFPYLYLGLFEKQLFILTLYMIPVAFFGVWVGRKINNILSDKIFFIIVYLTILILGLRLIFDSF